jgi:quercetin dioxygenase-like cupin family protein
MKYLSLWSWSLGFVAAIMLLAAAATAAAEESTPEAAPIVDMVLGHGLPADAPGKVLQLERVTIAPGAAIPTHIHPGAYVIYVESGDFGFTVIKGEAEITHAGTSATEPIAAGEEVIGHPGDVLFENAGVVHSARNAGSEPVVVLTAALLAADQPSLQLTNEEGTPTP